MLEDRRIPLHNRFCSYDCSRSLRLVVLSSKIACDYRARLVLYKSQTDRKARVTDCTLRFVSTGKNRGKPFRVSKKRNVHPVNGCIMSLFYLLLYNGYTGARYLNNLKRSFGNTASKV